MVNNAKKAPDTKTIRRVIPTLRVDLNGNIRVSPYGIGNMTLQEAKRRAIKYR